MSLNTRLSCIGGGLLWMAVASTLAGCASAPASTVPRADTTSGAQSTGDTMNSSREEPDLWHQLRNAAVDLYDAGFLFNPFLDGPIRLQLNGGR